MRLLPLVLMITLLAGCQGPGADPVDHAPADSVETPGETLAPGLSETAPGGGPAQGETQGSTTTVEADGEDADPEAARQPPPPMHWEGTFTLGADLGRVTHDVCGALSSCDARGFTLDGTYDLEATLTWTLLSNDFDLYLFQDGKMIDRRAFDSITQAPEPRVVLARPGVGPGEYDLVVVGDRMVKDSYDLDAVFSLPLQTPPPAPIHREGNAGSVWLPPVPPYSECQGPLTACDGTWFRLNGTYDVEATLVWELPTTDLDLVLEFWGDDVVELSRDGDNDPTETTTQQVLRYSDLPPGQYRLLVAPQHGVKIDFMLDVVFS